MDVETIIAVSVIFGFLWLFVSIHVVASNYGSWLTPAEWYDRGYNRFGAFIMWLLYATATAPASIPYGIGCLFKWLFTHRDY